MLATALVFVLQAAAPEPASPFQAPELISGSATVRCAVSRRREAENCEVVREDPPGRGFGGYARRLASDRIKLSAGAGSRPSITIPFRFELTPEEANQAGIVPPGRAVVGNPVWASRPSQERLAQAYPAAARRGGIEGEVRLRCNVVPDGRLQDCVLIYESPAGAGFGEATLRLTRRFRVASKDEDGQPTAGRPIIVPLVFQVY